MDTTHPRAVDFLFRDCHQVTRFFRSVGAEVLPAGELLALVSGTAISAEKEVEFLHKVSMAKGRRVEEVHDSSRVCEAMPAVSQRNKHVLLEGLAPATLSRLQDADEADADVDLVDEEWDGEEGEGEAATEEEGAEEEGALVDNEDSDGSWDDLGDLGHD